MADHHDTYGSGHPIGAAVLSSRAALAAVVDHPTWALGGHETHDLLVQVTALAAQVSEVQARLLAHAEATDATTTEAQATSTAAWLAATTRTTRRAARAATKLADDLTAHEATRLALARGEVLTDQASVIIEAVEALPSDAEVRERCEQHLLAAAAHHDAIELKILGRRVLAVVDPEAAEAHEADLLDKQERAAETKTRFSMGDNGDGTSTGRFTIPDLHGDMLRKALTALAAPRHVRSQGESYDHDRPSPARMGEAFCEFVGGYPAGELPHVGGTSASVVVTMDLATLLGGAKAASLDTGTMITAATARRLACQAGVIPAVLGGSSKVLDLGRKARFHTEAQRLALAIEQRHCQSPLCEVPAWLCHVHHTTPWAEGGHTNTDQAQLLCPRHHTLAHRDPPDPPLRT